MSLISEEELIDADYDGLSDSDILVLLLISDGERVSKTRLQKLAFLYRELYEKKTGITDHLSEMPGEEK